MYKYKPVRYLFRALNLIVYAAVISFAFLAIRDEIYVSDLMDSIFVDYSMGPQRCMLLAAFLLINVGIILLFKVFKKDNISAILYYVCDFIIRITFSIPLSFVVFYFAGYRFLGSMFSGAAEQAIVVVLLFSVFDYLMRWQIMFQLGVNYFRVHDGI